MSNPLIEPWNTPFELPPFGTISDDDFEPALAEALSEARANIAKISNNPDAPTFENTIEALELADEALGRVLSVFFNLAGTDSNPKREALQRQFSPLISNYSSEITQNTALFQRIEAIWEARDTLDLKEEQRRVLMLTHRSFVRAGARLEGAESDRLAQVKSRLATLGTEFTQNIIAEERDWVMELSDADLEGLPDFLVDAANAAGAAKKFDCAVITLSRSLIVPFLQFSPRRALREKAWRAWTSRCANGGATDNRARVTETLKLRSERAALLGYPDFASFKLETEMAKTPQAAQDLLMQVWEPARKTALSDAQKLEGLLRADGFTGDLQPWDWRYYSEKRRVAEHDLDESALKPYLQLDRMIEAAFECANRLFGIEARPLEGVALNHPDARAWEILRDGEHLAVFIGDYFARESKRSGAWCSALRSQRKLGGVVAPVVINVCNFAKPPEGRPALLSYDDARTLFHEFGHALHQMLSNVTYETISGTSVARDFVELPSQLFEHWLEVPEVLAEFATHADTGEPMPQEMLERLLAAGTYDMGFQTVEYIASALVDLDFHQGEPPSDPMQRQAEVLDSIGMPAAIAMRHATPHFAHVFAGDGYSSGYYSYMWSEVMDADAFDAFQEANGPFDKSIAAKLEEHVLSAGGSKDAAELYLEFRGKMPGAEALLKGRGLAA